LNIRYDNFEGSRREAEENIIFGLHVSGENTYKKTLPIIGGLALLETIVVKILFNPT